MNVRVSIQWDHEDSQPMLVFRRRWDSNGRGHAVKHIDCWKFSELNPDRELNMVCLSAQVAFALELQLTKRDWIKFGEIVENALDDLHKAPPEEVFYEVVGEVEVSINGNSMIVPVHDNRREQLYEQ